MTLDETLARIRREFREMPDLKLTLPQLRRLCNLPEAACEAAVAALVDSGVLRRAGNGQLTAA
ncbi:MAG TPA: hypothetical protein VG871_05095 [Vicinamibacterales bacterium]|nr:hypothetical protein [Vicinamibacterales bacterium]